MQTPHPLHVLLTPLIQLTRCLLLVRGGSPSVFRRLLGRAGVWPGCAQHAANEAAGDGGAAGTRPGARPGAKVLDLRCYVHGHVRYASNTRTSKNVTLFYRGPARGQGPPLLCPWACPVCLKH
eukprot:1191266-Prorocentrum_minimum.AAC.1